MPSAPSRCQSPLFPIPQLETSHLTLPSKLPSSEFFPEELLFFLPICCELSRLCCHGHSLLLSSYLHRIGRKENSACSACGHPLQDLNHLLLDCPASEPLRKSIFGSSLSLFSIYGPDLGVWPNCWISAEFLRAPIPRKGSGSTTTKPTLSSLHQAIKFDCFFCHCQSFNVKLYFEQILALLPK